MPETIWKEIHSIESLLNNVVQVMYTLLCEMVGITIYRDTTICSKVARETVFAV